jgi:hypothetical protein
MNNNKDAVRMSQRMEEPLKQKLCGCKLFYGRAHVGHSGHSEPPEEIVVLCKEHQEHYKLLSIHRDILQKQMEQINDLLDAVISFQ